jgi:hypothetical protein
MGIHCVRAILSYISDGVGCVLCGAALPASTSSVIGSATLGGHGHRTWVGGRAEAGTSFSLLTEPYDEYHRLSLSSWCR